MPSSQPNPLRRPTKASLASLLALFALAACAQALAPATAAAMIGTSTGSECKTAGGAEGTWKTFNGTVVCVAPEIPSGPVIGHELVRAQGSAPVLHDCPLTERRCVPSGGRPQGGRLDVEKVRQPGKARPSGKATAPVRAKKAPAKKPGPAPKKPAEPAVPSCKDLEPSPFLYLTDKYVKKIGAWQKHMAEWIVHAGEEMTGESDETRDNRSMTVDMLSREIQRRTQELQQIEDARKAWESQKCKLSDGTEKPWEGPSSQ